MLWFMKYGMLCKMDIVYYYRGRMVVGYSARLDTTVSIHQDAVSVVL